MAKITWQHTLLGLFLLSSPVINWAAPVSIDSIIMTVDNEPILKSEFLAGVAQARAEQMLRYGDTDRIDTATLQMQIKERLILEKIQLKYAKQFKMTVDDQFLNAAFAEMAEQQNLSPEAFRKKLEESNVSYAGYRNSLRKQLLLQQVQLSMVQGRVNVFPHEIEAAKKLAQREEVERKKFHLRQIVLTLPETPTVDMLQQAEAKISIVQAAFKAGEPFEKLARTHSQASEASKGGDLGWKGFDELPTAFTEQLVQAKAGDLLPPIRTGIGLHLLLVEDLKGDDRRVVEERHLQHLLLRETPVQSEAMILQRLREWVKQIRSGQVELSELAKQYSEDPGSKTQGGDLGWHTMEQYDPEFAQAANLLSPGQTSDPIKSAFGWHIIKLLGKRQGDKTEVLKETEIEAMIHRRKLLEAAERWLQEERASAYIDEIVDLASLQ